MTYGAFDRGLRAVSIACIGVFGVLLLATVLGGDGEGKEKVSFGTGEMEEICRVSPGVALYPWKAVIIHHSGTEDMDIDRLRRRYREQGFGLVPFHFLVHEDGSVESTAAWRLQKTVRQTLDEYFNTISIGVCVMGDFSRPGAVPPPAQMKAAVLLVRHLMDTYGIKKVNVLPCREVDDTTSPGKNFPWKKFLYSLRK